MDKAEAIRYLTQCADMYGDHWCGGVTWAPEDCPTCYGTNDAGHLRCFSRYGSTSAECAPVAWRIVEIISDANGEETTFDGLEHIMSLVVNGHDDVQTLLDDYGWGDLDPLDYS